jgi:adenosylcobinamide-GDP ribazoletransferase
VGLTDTAPVAALRGALGFLSRLPVGRDERAWEAFRAAPWTLPVAGYALGTLLALTVGVVLGAPVPAPTAAFAYLVAVLVLTGVNHADGVADLGDAAVVHGEPARRREVMSDTVTGVGGTLAVVTVVAGLALAGLGFAALPVATAAGLVVAGEVAAKLAMVVLVTAGIPAHEGVGAAVASDLDRADLPVPFALALPAVALPALALEPGRTVAPGLAVGAAALAGGLATAVALLWWARRTLDGVSGDVFGAGNELARVAALHAGLVTWQLADWPPVVRAAGRLPEVVAWTPW